MAASWDRKLMYERAYLMGLEFKGKGAHVVLGPVAGPLGRSAYGGRNWEGFAADPYLTGVAMEQTITGHQNAGVQATAKHFIGNEQETQRNPTFATNGSLTDPTFEAVSSNIDDRTMHEIYLWPFANAAHARVASFMCSKQRLNGSYACQNSKALNGLLKNELGFQGYIMSDWGATHSGVASVESGLDLDMPGGLGDYGKIADVGSYFGQNVTDMVCNGTVPELRLNDMIIRIMTPYFWLGQDQDFPTVDESSADLNTFSPRETWLKNFTFSGAKNRDFRDGHGSNIRRHGAAGIVVLKNINNALPLRDPNSIAVFGNDAGRQTQGFYNDVNFEYGTLTVGGGSGGGRLTYLVDPLQAVNLRASYYGAFVQHWLNNTLIATSNVSTLWIPRDPEVCLVFLKSWAEEGTDRMHLNVDWDGNDVVESVARECPNTIVVIHGSGINTLPFADNPNVTAILAAHYAGQETGNSIIDVLYGDVNPSGRLPYTIAFNESDYNAPLTTKIQTNGTDDWQSWFDEKLEIDYRYFDANNIKPRYEFGFGLSYTTFNISELKATRLVDGIKSEPDDDPIQPGGNPALWKTIYNVTASIKNSGPVSGAAVPQLYIGFPSSTPAGTPPKQLRGFDKIPLMPGETLTVTFELMRRDLSYWDITTQQWLIPKGDFILYAGWSSRDLPAKVTITPVP
jgi:beta-glucosidase